jgi:DNA polymerase-1
MLLVVDFLNVAYRSFHAIRALSTSSGQPTNAVYGFIQSIHHWMNEVKATHMAIVFDAETPQRRLEILPSYKANRPPTPEALISQLRILTDLFPLLGWPTALDPLHEADDLGAAIAVAAARDGETVRIASNDKDFLQIIGPRIHLLRSTPKEKVEVDEAWLEQRWGIRPSQVADFFALVGDSADNIPGAPGVGEKTAAELIHQFDSVENLLSRLAEVKRPRVRESLQASVEILRRNLRLITLCPVSDTPPLDKFRLQPPKYEPLLAALSKMEFKSLHARYEKESRETSSGRQGLLF